MQSIQRCNRQRSRQPPTIQGAKNQYPMAGTRACSFVLKLKIFRKEKAPWQVEGLSPRRNSQQSIDRASATVRCSRGRRNIFCHRAASEITSCRRWPYCNLTALITGAATSKTGTPESLRPFTISRIYREEPAITVPPHQVQLISKSSSLRIRRTSSLWRAFI